MAAITVLWASCFCIPASSHSVDRKCIIQLCSSTEDWTQSVARANQCSVTDLYSKPPFDPPPSKLCLNRDVFANSHLLIILCSWQIYWRWQPFQTAYATHWAELRERALGPGGQHLSWHSSLPLTRGVTWSNWSNFMPQLLSIKGEWFDAIQNLTTPSKRSTVHAGARIKGLCKFLLP